MLFPLYLECVETYQCGLSTIRKIFLFIAILDLSGNLGKHYHIPHCVRNINKKIGHFTEFKILPTISHIEIQI